MECCVCTVGCRSPSINKNKANTKQQSFSSSATQQHNNNSSSSNSSNNNDDSSAQRWLRPSRTPSAGPTFVLALALPPAPMPAQPFEAILGCVSIESYVGEEDEQEDDDWWLLLMPDTPPTAPAMPHPHRPLSPLPRCQPRTPPSPIVLRQPCGVGPPIRPCPKFVDFELLD